MTEQLGAASSLVLQTQTVVQEERVRLVAKEGQLEQVRRELAEVKEQCSEVGRAMLQTETMYRDVLNENTKKVTGDGILYSELQWLVYLMIGIARVPSGHGPGD